jgi:Skp family chaperone for outer membrane proteins
MRYLKTILLTATLALVCFLRIYSIEIPLDKRTVEQGSRINIAYVDIEKVFREHQLTKRLKDEFQAEVEKRKAEIDKVQAGVDELQKVMLATSTVITQIKSQIETKKILLAAATDQARISEDRELAKGSEIASLEELLTRKEAELEETKKVCDLKGTEIEQMVCKNRDELLNLEEKNTSQVLTDIYRVMQKLAEEEEVTIILDKNEVLYGKEVRDLTDKVIERLHGR